MAETETEQRDSSPSAREPERSPAAYSHGLQPAPWERLLEETPKAYAAFCVFRDQGVQRSYAGSARSLGKHESQVRRWATRFHWLERAHACDLAQSREVELLLRQEREQGARRRMRHSEQIERIAMAGILKLVTRDPETGEPTLSHQLTPELLCKLYELSLKIDRALPAPRAPDVPTSDTADPLQILSDSELEQIIALAQERAHPEGGSDDDSSTP